MLHAPLMQHRKTYHTPAAQSHLARTLAGVVAAAGVGLGAPRVTATGAGGGLTASQRVAAVARGAHLTPLPGRVGPAVLDTGRHQPETRHWTGELRRPTGQADRQTTARDTALDRRTETPDRTGELRRPTGQADSHTTETRPRDGIRESD